VLDWSRVFSHELLHVRYLFTARKFFRVNERRRRLVEYCVVAAVYCVNVVDRDLTLD